MNDQTIDVPILQITLPACQPTIQNYMYCYATNSHITMTIHDCIRLRGKIYT